MFDLRFTYRKREWIRAIHRYLFLSKMITVPMILTVAFMFAVMIDLIIIKKMLWFAVIFGCLSFFITVVYLFMYFYQPGYVYKKGHLADKEMHLVFTPDKIYNDSEFGSSELNWNYFRAYLESPGSFFLEMSKNHYTIIPKRVLGSKDQIKEFRKLLQDKIGMRG